MQRFQVLDKPVTLRSGNVALTDEQYALRPHCLKATNKKGVYEVTAPFQLKSGEVFGHDGHMSKSDALLIDPVPVANVKKPEPEQAAETVTAGSEDGETSEVEPATEQTETEEGEAGELNPLSVASLQQKVNLGFMKVKAFLKEVNVDVEDNEAILTQEVFDQVVAKVTAGEGDADAV
jgi:hypothetical protein